MQSKCDKIYFAKFYYIYMIKIINGVVIRRYMAIFHSLAKCE